MNKRIKKCLRNTNILNDHTRFDIFQCICGIPIVCEIFNQMACLKINLVRR